ncbi:hypothetical protein ACYSUO_39555 [Streptomyces sp. UC4497]
MTPDVPAERHLNDRVEGHRTTPGPADARKKFYGYKGALDGITGPGTKAAFWRKAYANPAV